MSKPVAAPISSKVLEEPHPTLTAPTMAYTNSERPAVTVMAPGKSNVVTSLSAWLSAIVHGARPAAMIAIGTVTKNTHRQLNPLVKIPPSSTPAAPPAPTVAPQTPRARLRSEPSAKVVVSIERAAGDTIAAPIPWTARAAINHPEFW